eukprot:12303382-Karenia_brevis.AAC.1
MRAKFGDLTLHIGWACSGQYLRKLRLATCGSQHPNTGMGRVWNMAWTYQCPQSITTGTLNKTKWPRLGHRWLCTL